MLSYGALLSMTSTPTKHLDVIQGWRCGNLGLLHQYPFLLLLAISFYRKVYSSLLWVELSDLGRNTTYSLYTPIIMDFFLDVATGSSWCHDGSSLRFPTWNAGTGMADTRAVAWSWLGLAFVTWPWTGLKSPLLPQPSIWTADSLLKARI